MCCRCRRCADDFGGAVGAFTRVDACYKGAIYKRLSKEGALLIHADHLPGF